MGRLSTVRFLLKHFPQLGLQLCQTILNPAVPHTPGSANLVKEVKREIFDMLKGMTIRVFLKGHFVKKKCSPHHVTGGYLERSYPEGEADQTSLGGRH